MGILVFLLYVIIIILVLWGWLWTLARIKKARYRRILEQVFDGHTIPNPMLRIGSSYSWPTFDLIFMEKSDYEYSLEQELVDDFKKRIKNKLGKDFDANLAIRASYRNQRPKDLL